MISCDEIKIRFRIPTAACCAECSDGNCRLFYKIGEDDVSTCCVIKSFVDEVSLEQKYE